MKSTKNQARTMRLPALKKQWKSKQRMQGFTTRRQLGAWLSF